MSQPFLIFLIFVLQAASLFSVVQKDLSYSGSKLLHMRNPSPPPPPQDLMYQVLGRIRACTVPSLDLGHLSGFWVLSYYGRQVPKGSQYLMELESNSSHVTGVMLQGANSALVNLTRPLPDLSGFLLNVLSATTVHSQQDGGQVIVIPVLILVLDPHKFLGVWQGGMADGAAPRDWAIWVRNEWKPNKRERKQMKLSMRKGLECIEDTEDTIEFYRVH